jgi:hypothetical protein
MIRKMMTSRSINGGVILLLGVMIAADGAMILRVRAAAAHGVHEEDFLCRPGAKAAAVYGVHHADPLDRFARKLEPIPPPDGFTAKGVRVGIVPGRRAGWAVRYAANRCVYCRRDNTTWNRLAAELQRLGYQVIDVVPSAKDHYPNDAAPRGAPQEAYVSVKWIRRFRLTVTPTLLIFGPDQRLIWSRQGMLYPADPKSAVRVIEETAARTNE